MSLLVKGFNKFACLLVVFMAIVLPVSAQKQNNQWRFGYKGAINFNTNPPSGINAGALQTGEGSASVADRNTGNILFHTDGVTIWNANNQPMPNGTGLLGSTSGELSSTTAAVIIPKPLSANIYYVVTIDEQFSPAGVRYSEVDMALNNGLGDVIAGRKNILLFSTNSEKLTYVPASDGCSYWLLTHKTIGDTYAAFRVTSAGINTTPVLSTVGETHGNGAGHLKVNRQFNRLATGNFQTGDLEMFDFNNSTGEVSNAIAIKTSLVGAIYGVEFSPGGKLLYISNLDRITQYNVSSTDPATIAASAYWVSQNQQTGYLPATLQLGPDNKIYVAAGSVDVINNPDAAGEACNFQRNAVTLLGGGTGYGLPGWIYELSPKTNNKINVADTCFGKNTRFSVADETGVVKFNWNFNDPNTGGFNTSNLADPLHQFSAAGVYNVRLILEYPCYNDTVLNTVTISTCNNTSGITGIKFLDDTCSSLSLRVSVTGTTSSPYIFWRFGDPASGTADTVTITGASNPPFPTHTFSAPGLYNICAYFKEPGQPVDSVCRSFNIGQCCIATIKATDSCFNNAMKFNVISTSPVSGVTWDFADTGNPDPATGINASHVFSRKGTFTVRATVITPCGEVTPGFLVNIVDCVPNPDCTGSIEVGGICGNLPIPFSISSTNTITSIRWNFGDPASGTANFSNLLNPVHKFTVTAGYTIGAIVDFNCGTDTIIKSISLEECNSTCTGSIGISDSCLENAIAFTATASSNITSIAWNFNDPLSGTQNQSTALNPTHIFTNAGTYNVSANITAACGSVTVSKPIAIKSCGSCVVSLANAFSPNGDGRNDQLSPLINCIVQQFEWQIFDRWGRQLFKTNNSVEKWNGNYRGKPVSAGVYYYRLRYKASNGNLVDKTGSITVVR